jgi:hypothetical protein
LTRIALTCPNVLEGALPGRISGAARTSWAMGARRRRGGNAPIRFLAAVGARALSGGCCGHMTIGQANWGKERLGRIASLPGPFDELSASPRAVHIRLRRVYRLIE